jgi:hypothetical protein
LLPLQTPKPLSNASGLLLNPRIIFAGILYVLSRAPGWGRIACRRHVPGGRVSARVGPLSSPGQVVDIRTPTYRDRAPSPQGIAQRRCFRIDAIARNISSTGWTAWTIPRLPGGFTVERGVGTGTAHRPNFPRGEEGELGHLEQSASSHIALNPPCPPRSKDAGDENVLDWPSRPFCMSSCVQPIGVYGER